LPGGERRISLRTVPNRHQIGATRIRKPRRRTLLGLGFLLGGSGLAAAQNFQWQANTFNDAGNGGKYTAFLTQGVPETDNIAFRATCQAGSSARFAPTVLVYNTGRLPRNAQLTVSQNPV
jgi:hypothetical protein